MDKTTGRRILGFDFQAAVDTYIYIRLDHGYGRGRLPSLGNIGRIAYEDVDDLGGVPGTGSIQHFNFVGGHRCGRIAGLPLFGFLEVVDVVNDAVCGNAGFLYRPQEGACAANVISELVKPATLIASKSNRPGIDSFGVCTSPRLLFDERAIAEYIRTLSHKSPVLVSVLVGCPIDRDAYKRSNK